MPEDRSPILSSVQNIFSIPDLRKRVLFMLGLLAVYRVGAWIPTPGINQDALEALFQTQAGTIFGFLDIFSGGALRRFSIFALGIMPYITASIILQLATVVVPYLEKLAGFEAGAQVDPEILKSKGLVKNLQDGLKILGVGELPHALHVRAHKFSKSAKEKIEKVGGTIEVIA